MSNFIQAAMQDSGLETASGNGAGFDVKLQSGPFAFVLDVTAQVGTTLDVDIEGYDPISDKWVVLGSFTQVGAATGTEVITISEIAFALIRAAWVLVGTSYTFSVGVQGKPRY